ncbi:hypothetical protein C4585_02915 [Candidatus Parcubacteria bacterium]|nr:MAG: hypothetical protein C4585_02915 [Candidatus Parcubacteria bacterium]
MIHFFTGTDREKARAAMNKEATQVIQKIHGEIVRITDAHSVEDLRAALQGAGMFGAPRVLVFENVLTNEDMKTMLLLQLSRLGENKEPIFWYEEKLAADLRKKIEKFAEKTVRHDAAKKERDTSIFTLPNALARGDKKALWVEYQRALARGDAPEAIHGVLFWGAKRMATANSLQGKALVAELAELPHEARRKSVELEYALERYLLTVNKG